jgi:SAM-dependent methyltransferase
MKSYDRAYFDRWYREPRTRVHAPAEVRRKVRMVVGVAEYMLGRPLRSVLDVGCGEGAWQPILKRLRPAARYVGVDPSAYAVRRFGRRRNIRLGSLERLDEAGLGGPFDLVVCCDVLHYVPADDLARGLRHVRDLLGGVAYLEMYTSDDAIEGDVRGWRGRRPDFYRRLARRAALTPCGLHCYLSAELARHAAALEKA